MIAKLQKIGRGGGGHVLPAPPPESASHKVENNGIPSSLAELIPSESNLYNTQNTRNITTYSCRTDAFKYSFFPWMINEWNKLNFNV